MTDFYSILKHVEYGQSRNPFSGQINGEWCEGLISIDFLNKHFSQYETAEEMMNATESEGLKLYFKWLRDEGILK